MSSTASPETLDHLTALVAQAEPRWDPSLVKVVLLSHRSTVDGTDLAIAALRCAKSGKFPTPKAIFWRGPHWDGLATTPPELRPRETCGICGRTEERCYSTRVGIDDDHRFEPRRRASAQ